MSYDRYRDQNFSKLSKHHRDLGVPWSDPTFPPSDASIGTAKVKNLPRNIEWKRPRVRTEAVRFAHFITL